MLYNFFEDENISLNALYYFNNSLQLIVVFHTLKSSNNSIIYIYIYLLLIALKEN